MSQTLTTNRRHYLKLAGWVVGIPLLVFIAFGLLWLKMQQAREEANRSTCINNLSQLATACHNYSTGRGSDGELPPHTAWFNADQNYGIIIPRAILKPGDEKNSMAMPAFYIILPYMELNCLYGDNRHQKKIATEDLKIYRCPSDPGNGTEGVNENRRVGSNYLFSNAALSLYGDYGEEGFQNGKGGTNLRTSFKDGTSNTILAAERISQCETDAQGKGESRYTRWAVTNSPYPDKAQLETVGCILYVKTDKADVLDFPAPTLVPANLQAGATPNRCAAASSGAWGLTISSPHRTTVNVAMADGNVRSVNSEAPIGAPSAITSSLAANYTLASEDSAVDLSK